MKNSTPAPVILFRLFCMYLIGTTLHGQFSLFSNFDYYDLEWILDTPVFAIQLCTGAIVPFTMLYCSLKPSKTALTAIRVLFSLNAAYAFFSIASTYARFIDIYGYEDTRQLFPPWVILLYLVEVTLLFLFFVSKRISGWFSRYGLKESAYEHA